MFGFNWSGFWDKAMASRDITASVITLAMIGIGGAVFAWLLAAPLVPSSAQPLAPKRNCASTPTSGPAAAQPVKVSDASGSTATLNLFIDRNGDDQARQSTPLAVQKGRLCPGGILTASVGDLVRSDGLILPAHQVAAWGQVNRTGTHVTIWVSVNPRYSHISGFGGYSGIASLDDPGAIGANVPVNIHVLYPNIAGVISFSMLAAFAGFAWAWLVHDLRNIAENYQSNASDFFWRNIILRIAVLLASAIPVVNAQVLANPDWQGDLTQYITLATLAGAAALALTPTLRALALPHQLKRQAGAHPTDQEEHPPSNGASQR